ncbi:MAG: hypothetical protein FWC57_04720, partial [Endomicrobia bacterium]|nr:hypothetical protein [Endomicrobiia bacterium]
YKTDLQDNNPVFNLVTALKDYNFKFSSNETYGDNGVIIKVSGTFERGGKHGIEAAYIKKGLYLWQIVAAFPFSEENKKKALDFIDSAVIDPAINGAKPETKE